MRFSINLKKKIWGLAEQQTCLLCPPHTEINYEYLNSISHRDNYGARERGRERKSFNMQIKCITLFSFVKINHKWAGTHNHRAIWWAVLFLDHTPQNLSAPLSCVLLRVYVDFREQIKTSNYQRLCMVTAQHTSTLHVIFLFITSNKIPDSVNSLLPKRLTFGLCGSF